MYTLRFWSRGTNEGKGPVILYEAVIKHVFFPAYEGLIKRRDTPRCLKEYERSQWFPPDQVERIQLEKLNRLIEHCWANVPHLNTLWTKNGLLPGSLQSVRDLERFPLITKQEIKANYEGMIATNWRGRTMSKTTGGSTGDPFKFEYTPDSYSARTAVMIRGYRWAGVELGRKALYVWGLPHYKSKSAEWKDFFYQRLHSRYYLNSYEMKESEIDHYLAQIERWRPKTIVGFVAPTLLLARRILETGRSMPPIGGIITGAEALYDPERKLLQDAFHAPVFNTYGCREVMMVAGECSLHTGLHVNSDHLVVETVDSAGRQLSGEPGDVTLTDLHNYGMPLVRYQNGDRATYSDSLCSCGRGLPLLRSIDGRILDLIRTPDGNLVPGEFFIYLMLGFPQIHGYQVVQTKVDEIEIRVQLTSGSLSEKERRQMDEASRKSIGQKMKVTIKEVDEIPLSASGKRRVTMSLVSETPTANHQL